MEFRSAGRIVIKVVIMGRVLIVHQACFIHVECGLAFCLVIAEQNVGPSLFQISPFDHASPSKSSTLELLFIVSEVIERVEYR